MICMTHFKHFQGNYFLTKKWYERRQNTQASPTKKDTTRSACMAGHHHRNIWKYGDFVIWVKQPFDSTPDQWLVTLPFPLLTFGLSPIFSSKVIVGGKPHKPALLALPWTSNRPGTQSLPCMFRINILLENESSSTHITGPEGIASLCRVHWYFSLAGV